jgi:hypothetical protein
MAQPHILGRLGSEAGIIGDQIINWNDSGQGPCAVGLIYQNFDELTPPYSIISCAYGGTFPIYRATTHSAGCETNLPGLYDLANVI